MNKKIAIGIIVIVALIIGGYFWLQNQTKSVPDGMSVPNKNIVENSKPEDQSCQLDSDCVMSPVKCSCDCGIPINKINIQKYLDRYEEACKSYKGTMCDMQCGQILKCENNLCVVNIIKDKQKGAQSPEDCKREGGEWTHLNFGDAEYWGCNYSESK